MMVTFYTLRTFCPLWLQPRILSLAEVEELGKLNNINIPEPDKIIFEHTHEPISLENPVKVASSTGKEIYLFNTGGWLWEKAGKMIIFRGGVVKYETATRIRSQFIS